jgi:hypothetical protein
MSRSTYFWVVSFTPRPLCPRGKRPRYPLDRRLGGPQNRYGERGEEKILDPTGTQLRPLHRPARSQSLYRLSYPGSSKEFSIYEYNNINPKRNGKKHLVWFLECLLGTATSWNSDCTRAGFNLRTMNTGEVKITLRDRRLDNGNEANPNFLFHSFSRRLAYKLDRKEIYTILWP